MQNSSRFTVGWIDTTIHDFLSEIEPSPSMKYALLTFLDSSPGVASIFQKNERLHKLQKHLSNVGNGVLLTTHQLLRLDREERLFFGFDEVWFFSHKNISPKPTTDSIVGPERITTSAQSNLETWMESNGCSLGLGDGAGMNFCAKLQGIAKYLVESQGGIAAHPAVSSTSSV